MQEDFEYQYERDARANGVEPETFLRMIEAKRAEGYARAEAYERALAEQRRQRRVTLAQHAALLAVSLGAVAYLLVTGRVPLRVILTIGAVSVGVSVAGRLFESCAKKPPAAPRFPSRWNWVFVPAFLLVSLAVALVGGLYLVLLLISLIGDVQAFLGVRWW